MNEARGVSSPRADRSRERPPRRAVSGTGTPGALVASMNTFRPDSASTHILAAIDYSESSTPVVEQAIAIARQSRPCDLHFLHVNQFGAEDDEGQEGLRFELLEWLGARLPQADEDLAGITVVAHEACGDPWRAIVQTASDLLIDLVVMGTHGRKGVRRIIMGSVAEAVSRHCGCSVLVVRPKVHKHPFAELEPICGVCAETRLQSQGNVLWCHDHLARRDRHAHYVRGIGRWVRQSSRREPVATSDRNIGGLATGLNDPSPIDREPSRARAGV
jgi:nucleotide-binding universal stress UspA family protein